MGHVQAITTFCSRTTFYQHSHDPEMDPAKTRIDPIEHIPIMLKLHFRDVQSQLEVVQDLETMFLVSAHEEWLHHIIHSTLDDELEEIF
jgi:hypothetical protein